jgi:hypothetical protein
MERRVLDGAATRAARGATDAMEPRIELAHEPTVRAPAESRMEGTKAAIAEDCRFKRTESDHSDKELGKSPASALCTTLLCSPISLVRRHVLSPR